MVAFQEGRLRISKYKIHQTQCEIENLQAIDQNVRSKYQEIMGSLRCDLVSNEQECHRLQEQIEWVTRRRAQIRQEVGTCTYFFIYHIPVLAIHHLLPFDIPDDPVQTTAITTSQISEQHEL